MNIVMMTGTSPLYRLFRRVRRKRLASEITKPIAKASRTFIWLLDVSLVTKR